MHIIKELELAGKISPPKFVSDNICLLSIGGSYAYGISTDLSDTDLIGVVIPPKEYVYPKRILGYDHIETFNDYQQHHINHNGIEYDIKLYSLPRIFFLSQQGNPNLLDFLMTKNDCVLYQNNIGKKILDFAPNFLSKECVDRFFGFSFNHLRSMENRQKSGIYPEKRKILYERFGYDTKDLAHCIRCLLNLKSILETGIYKINENADFIKQIRNGYFTLDNAIKFVKKLEIETKEIEKVSLLIEKPNLNIIRAKLVELLEEYYT